MAAKHTSTQTLKDKLRQAREESALPNVIADLDKSHAKKNTSFRNYNTKRGRKQRPMQLTHQYPMQDSQDLYQIASGNCFDGTNNITCNRISPHRTMTTCPWMLGNGN